MPTTSEQEIEANSQWRLRPEYQDRPVHELLLQNEFRSAESVVAESDRALRRVLEHCYDLVPYYRKQFQQAGISRRSLRAPEALRELPILGKQQIEQHGELLLAQQLMSGQRLSASTRTSGSTGQPTVVQHSDLSLGMFRWLKQRELRWFRFDPNGSLLSIRPRTELPLMANGEMLADGEVLDRESWQDVGELFQTGPAIAYANTNTVQQQVDLLRERRPDYLIMQSACLEHLSMQALDPAAKQNLKSVLAISQTLTPAMRQQVENALGVQVQQNYGLNEIGLVASRCPEAGRYHVHSEHCIVEIVNEDGSPCKSGERGRLLVTGLSNSRMPLLRYDADDWAEAVAGPCACGRSLPSFGQIYGRYRRTAYLPEGTFQRWAAIQLVFYRWSTEHPSTVRKYQAYQDKRGDFLLRVDCEESSFADLSRRISQEFDQAYEQTSSPGLEILRNDQFLQATANKFPSFISEFTPEMDQ